MALTVPHNTFTDGMIVGQDDLSRLSWNVDALAQNLLGKPAAAGASGKPVCKVNLSSSFSVPNGAAGTNQIVTWNRLITDNDGMWPGSPSDHMVVQTAGWYRIVAHAWWASASAAKERVVQILINGQADPLNVVATRNALPGTAAAYCHTVRAYEHLSAGATIYVGVFQNTGSALNLITGGISGTSWTAAWRAPY